MTKWSIYRIQTVQRLILSKGAKITKFYHITVILQYCWDKTIARSGDMYRDGSAISSLVIKCFGITNTSIQNFAIRISSVKTCTEVFAETKSFFFNIFNIDVSSLLMSSTPCDSHLSKIISKIMWYRLNSFFLLLYLTWGVVLCGICLQYLYEIQCCHRTKRNNETWSFLLTNPPPPPISTRDNIYEKCTCCKNIIYKQRLQH